MEKNEMMKRYEQETGLLAVEELVLEGMYDEYEHDTVCVLTSEYGQWLEAKATAYYLAVQENVAHEFTITQALKGRTDYEGLPVSEINWLQVLRREVGKAKDYDRLMGGGKKTPKEVANFLGHPIAMDAYTSSEENQKGDWCCFKFVPVIDHEEEIWSNNKRGWYVRLPYGLIEYTGDWKDSLTVPDGWEEK